MAQDVNAFASDPLWMQSGMAPGGNAMAWPDPPPSRMDQAYQTSIDRWKQLAKDAFFAPSNALHAFNERPTFNNALGIMPMGTFAGPLAKTANKAALERARQMAMGGYDVDVGKYIMPASREQIWKETGWFQTPDKNWKFEIPDNKAMYGPGKIEQGFRDQGYTTEQIRNMGTATDMSRVLEHPELYKAYPEAANWPWAAIPPNKMYNKNAGGEWLGRNQGMSINNEVSPSLMRGRSVTLHEAQHGIQEIEGWPIGTNPAHETSKWFDTTVRPIEREMVGLSKTHPEAWNAFISEQHAKGMMRAKYGENWAVGATEEELNNLMAMENKLDAMPGGAWDSRR